VYREKYLAFLYVLKKSLGEECLFEMKGKFCRKIFFYSLFDLCFYVIKSMR
jgi:hypothetical protein